jgi:hypothetical protein
MAAGSAVSLTSHAWLVAGLLVATVAVGAIVHFRFKPATKALDLQLPKTPADLERAVGATAAERRRNRNNTWADFAFLTAYTAVFVAAGSLLAREGPTWAVIVGIAAIATGILTGVLDVLENLTIFAELRPGANLPELYSRVRHFSIPKWIAAALTNGLLISIVAFGGWTILLGLLAEALFIGSLLTLRRAFP